MTDAAAERVVLDYYQRTLGVDRRTAWWLIETTRREP